VLVVVVMMMMMTAAVCVNSKTTTLIHSPTAVKHVPFTLEHTFKNTAPHTGIFLNWQYTSCCWVFAYYNY